MTFFVLVIMLIYASIKAIHLFSKHNPNVVQIAEKNYYDYNERLDLNQIGFRLAFSIEGYHQRERKDSHAYVKYLVRIFGIADGEEYETILNFHECKSSDWDQFPPPAEASRSQFESIRDDPNRGMYCIDWDEDIQIYGNEKDKQHQRIEIVMAPCNYLHQHLGYEGDVTHEDCIADLDEQIKYLGALDFMLYYTEDVFKQGLYEDKSILRQSNLLNIQVDEKSPNWINTLVQRNMLYDETQLLQFGYASESPFYSYTSKFPQPSAWNKFPTAESPKERYKFTSVEVNFSLDTQHINRQTYNILDWLGDMGGLLDSLYMITAVIIYPISQFALKTKLLSQLFRYKGGRDELIRRMTSQNMSIFKSTRNVSCGMETESILKSIRLDFQNMIPIKRVNCYRSFFCCLKNYRQMLLKSQSKISKELDLRKFIYRQRLQTTAILGLLTGRQNFFVDKMSQLVIRESSNLDETSDDSELSDWQQDNMDYAKALAESRNKVDERLINLYRIRKAN